eukprot:950067-Amphidinium_carterae.1
MPQEETYGGYGNYRGKGKTKYTNMRGKPYANTKSKVKEENTQTTTQEHHTDHTSIPRADQAQATTTGGDQPSKAKANKNRSLYHNVAYVER